MNYLNASMSTTRTGFFQDFDHQWLRKLTFRNLLATELLNWELPKESSNKPKAWIFDLDSTLFVVGPRIRAIFVEFLRQHPKPPFQWHKSLEFMHPDRQPYDIELGFRRIFEEWDSHNAKIWAHELWQEFSPFWYERFFSNRYLHYDKPYPNSVKFVNSVLERGFEIVYLTGRDRPRCGHGTRLSLQTAGFPLGAECHLWMKVDAEQSDLDYKQQTARLLHSSFEPQVFIDNEPENIVMFAKEFPTAQIVFFHSIMSERNPLGDFRTILGGREALRLESYDF